jgi:hypothetical protein
MKNILMLDFFFLERSEKKKEGGLSNRPDLSKYRKKEKKSQKKRGEKTKRYKIILHVLAVYN